MSGVTGKPLLVRCDQISCCKCSRLLTKLLAESGKKKAVDLSLATFNLEHDPPCYRNSKRGPATAEERAYHDCAESLVIDPLTNDFYENHDESFVVG